MLGKIILFCFQVSMLVQMCLSDIYVLKFHEDI